MTPLRVFVGFDSKEAIAYHVLVHSILSRASSPVAIIPLVRSQLRAIHTRERGPLESTDFSITRFLVPYLSGYEGVSIYMDCDMLCLTDITKLAESCSGIRPGLWSALVAPEAVWVAQHDYTPRAAVKMDGQIQTSYPRKNWSSLIVFDNARCRALTPAYVNTAPGLDLHRFSWLKDEEIGSLPLDWNWLVGEYRKNQQARVFHYTLGGPWLDGYRACDHAEEWYAEREAMLSPRAVGVPAPRDLPTVRCA